MNYDKKYFLEFTNVLKTLSKDKELLVEFMQGILPPSEYRDLVMRWQIAKKLSNKENQRAVAGDLGVGIATVTRGSRELQKESSGLKKAIEFIK
jgi:TrpR family trp operon transcriptional repressor